MELLAQEREPAEILAWMVVRGIISEIDFLDSASKSLDIPPGEEADQRAEIAGEALSIIQAIRSELNRQKLQKLLDESIINQSQFDKTANLLPDDRALVSSAATLVWMMAEVGVLTEEEWEAIVDITNDARTDSTKTERLKIVDEAKNIHEKICDEYYRLAKAHFWQQVFPGPKLAWIFSAILLVGGFGWYVATPARTPDCDAKTIRQTLGSMLFRANLQGRISSLRLEPSDTPSLGGQTEIGYIKTNRVRACITTVKFGEKESSWAYLIKPGEEKGKFIVAGANEEIIRLRYGNIDANGDLPNKAEPIGRQAMETAIRNGVTEFRKKFEIQNPGLSKLLGRMRPKKSQSDLLATDPDREREIADIEPAGSCREIEAGNKYVCNVMLERNDIFSSFSEIVVGDFTFERSGGSEWRTTSSFPEEYSAAIATGQLN